MTVAITRADLDAAGLRAAAAASTHAAASRRMLGLALVMDGQTRAEAARTVGMDRQTSRDWVHRYNERGLEGLHNTPCRGAPPRKLSAEQEATVGEWVRQGPSLEKNKIVRWRLVDLRDQIAREFGVPLHERTVGKLMARLNFARVSVRRKRGCEALGRSVGVGWRPVPGHELIDAVLRPTVHQPGEQVGDIGERIDAVQFARLDQ
jgi:transposase